MSDVVIWTDGSVHPNPNGHGGAAWRIIVNGVPFSYGAKYFPNTTNQRMEMQAAIEGLAENAAFFGFTNLELRSDSSYLINCFRQKWYAKWLVNGWRNANSKPVANVDLWEKLLWFNDLYNIEWIHVKGHVGVEHNEACDQLAGEVRVNKKDFIWRADKFN